MREDDEKLTSVSKMRDQGAAAEAAALALGPWFAERLEDVEAAKIVKVDVPKSGLSADTFIMTLRWIKNGSPVEGRYVVRTHPDQLLFYKPDLIAEARILKTVGDSTDLPVPKVHWIVEDESPLGRPFYVMEYIDGRIPSDVPIFLTEGWVLDLAPSARSRLWTSGLHFLADLHSLDLSRLDLPAIPGRDPELDPLAAELEYLRVYHEWSTHGDWPDLTQRLFDWLWKNRPDCSEPALCWGDARPGNMIFSNDGCEAVLDWEMATVCDPTMDVAYWIHTDINYQAMSGCALLPGMPGPSEVVKIYEERSGRKVGDLNFFLGLCAFRSMTFLVRAKTLMENAGDYSMSQIVLEQTPMAEQARQSMESGYVGI